MTNSLIEKLSELENFENSAQVLFQLVRNNDLNETQNYIKSNHLTDKDVSCLKDPRGNSLLHYACANGCEETSSFLISYANQYCISFIDSQNNEGNTSLHWAALNNQIGIVKILLSSGANATIKNGFNNLAFDEAEIRGFTELSSILLNKTKLEND